MRFECSGARGGGRCPEARTAIAERVSRLRHLPSGSAAPELPGFGARLNSQVSAPNNRGFLPLEQP
jgi:hypothetical protein